MSHILLRRASIRIFPRFLHPVSHLMHTTILRPPAHPLAKEVKYHTKRAPQEDQAHIQHDRRDIPISNDPRRDEFAEAISPNVLVDRNRHEDAACNWLVAVDGVGGCNGG